MSRSFASKIEAANLALMVNGDLSVIGEFFSPDYVVHLTDRDTKKGHDVIRSVVTMYRRAFSNIQVTVEVLVQAENRIAWQRTIRATHQDSFKGFPATGSPIFWREMVTSRFRDGLINEEWVVTDLAERLLLGRKR